MRRIMHSNRIGVWLIACALALRVIVAPGFMPVASANGFTIEMCTGQGAVKLHVPGKPSPEMPVKSECSFGVLSLSGTHVASPELVVPMAFSAGVSARSTLRRSPHVGVPAPPPPPTGPPLV